VSFRHYNPARFLIVSAGTLCVINTSGANEERIGHGRTNLSPEDQYCKERGRKLSLARAMNELGLDRSERLLFWRAYFEKQGREIEVK
jgi:hypothetical protein